ncbi:hypothetical protein KZX47_12820 [Thermus sp. SYSU G05001]|uniref:Uncharacterized protein n=1 Tax=Thermus brevis TaxID=2862456 RepID=A0ABS7A118_9DEIN|nr:hypothetical protein [Thermus brevis]MBW6396027.1 hypothetical protein [Thermus brevis]
MGYVVTQAYKERVAKMIAGEGTWSLVPAYAALGSGRYDPQTGTLTDPSPTDGGLAAPLSGYSNLPVTVSRVGTAVRVDVAVPGGASSVNVTEAALYTSDGIPIVLDAFRPVALQAPLTLYLTYTIYPEV